MSARTARRLARAHGVHAVTLNGEMKPQDVRASNLATAFPFSTNATTVWNSNTPATGKGVGVAVIDTGIAGNLADFRVSPSDSRSRVVASAVINPGATDNTIVLTGTSGAVGSLVLSDNNLPPTAGKKS